MNKVIILLSLLLCSLTITAKDIVVSSKLDVQKQMTCKNVNYVIKTDIDLHGKVINIPPESTLVFEGGVISNGTLVGAKTKLCYKKTIFNEVQIKGTWNVPIISSSMFLEPAKNDVLKQVFALAHKDVNNTIHIQPGDYSVTVSTNTKGALYIPSNTTVILDGTVILEPNAFLGYAVFYIKDAERVCIKGSGSIIGDKNTHLGTKGEWGMGIQIMNSRNVEICNLEISNCWGDGIYIGNESLNISISQCNIHHSRRQGISITHASKVIIDNCIIHDIEGTPPEYAIDFEPNANCSVHHMTVSNTEIYNCKGGIIAGIKGVIAENASVGDIVVKKCYIHNLRTNNTFRWHNCSNILVVNCSIDKPLHNCTFKVDADNIKYRNIKVKSK